MRKAAIALSLALAACAPARATPTAAPPLTETFVPKPSATPFAPLTQIVLDARAFADALRESGLPVTNVRVLTVETDPNEMLGKPNGYNGKVNWTDTRVAVGQPTAELFADDASMQDRFRYLDGIAKRVPGSPYLFRNAETRVLLRVPAGLTPSEAHEYELWLSTLVWPRFLPNGKLVTLADARGAPL